MIGLIAIGDVLVGKRSDFSSFRREFRETVTKVDELYVYNAGGDQFPRESIVPTATFGVWRLV